jgi:hypothetical protein
MGIGLKIIAASDAPVRLSSNQEISFKGLAGITNEDPHVDVWVLNSSETPSSVWHVYSGGTMLGAAFAMQYQYQDMGSIGNVPSEYWIAAGQFGPAPGDTIVKGAYINDPQNTPTCNFVADDFVVPNVGNTVQVTILADGAAFDVGDYVDRDTNAGLFCGGLFWDIVSVDDTTHVTLRNRGIFGAVVVLNG